MSGHETSHPAQAERHELTFEDFCFDTSVDEDGSVWVSFHEAGKCAFSCSLGTLQECVEFARRHGALDV